MIHAQRVLVRKRSAFWLVLTSYSPRTFRQATILPEEAQVTPDCKFRIWLVVPTKKKRITRNKNSSWTGQAVTQTEAGGRCGAHYVRRTRQI